MGCLEISQGACTAWCTASEVLRQVHREGHLKTGRQRDMIQTIVKRGVQGLEGVVTDCLHTCPCKANHPQWQALAWACGWGCFGIHSANGWLSACFGNLCAGAQLEVTIS